MNILGSSKQQIAFHTFTQENADTAEVVGWNGGKSIDANLENRLHYGYSFVLKGDVKVMKLSRWLEQWTVRAIDFLSLTVTLEESGEIAMLMPVYTEIADITWGNVPNTTERVSHELEFVKSVHKRCLKNP